MPKKTNPRNIPCSAEEAHRIADLEFYLAIGAMLTAVAETETYSNEEIEGLWDAINAKADRISQHKENLFKLADELTKAGVELGTVTAPTLKPTNLREAKTNGKRSFKLACVIMLSVLREDGKLDTEALNAVWARTQYQEDSYRRRYCTVRDICTELLADYNIMVGKGYGLC